MTVLLREARPEDARVIAAMRNELGHPTPENQIPARLSSVLAEGGRVVLAEVDALPAGLMCLARHSALHSPGPIAYITALVTSASTRRAGVGRALVEEAKRWAESQGCVRLSVTSAEKRADAHAFYPACGLPYTGRRFAIALDAPAF
jgi:GNAT superfamily N-acetyltransferase